MEAAVLLVVLFVADVIVAVSFMRVRASVFGIPLFNSVL